MAWDMAAWGVEWLDDQRKSNLAATITYLRNGAARFTAEDATSCKIAHKILQDDIETEINGRDFIIPRHYFEDDMPIHGDIIQLTIGEETLTFRVANPGTGTDVYRDHDSQRLAIRIHTLLESVE